MLFYYDHVAALNQDKKGDILQVPLSVRGTHDQDMLFDENSTKYVALANIIVFGCILIVNLRQEPVEQL